MPCGLRFVSPTQASEPMASRDLGCIYFGTRRTIMLAIANESPSALPVVLELDRARLTLTHADG